MAGIQDIPLRIPEQWSKSWFEKFITTVLAPMDVRNAQGSGVTVSSDGNSVASLDATAELAAHVAEDNPHTQYAKGTDLATYTQRNAAEVIEEKWTFPAATPVVTAATTVGSLPSAATAGAGARAFVTDANSSTFNAAAVGGGANKVPVFSDGAAWRVG